MVQSLPRDILHEIFKRLPFKSIVRFKSVCKEWYSILLDPAFIKAHNTYRCRFDGDQQIIVDYNKDADELNIVKYTNLVDPKASKSTKMEYPKDCENDFCHSITRIIGSYNGIVALSTRCGVMLWNPITNERVSISPANFIPYSAKGVILLGLCYNDICNQYYVILASHFESPPQSPTNLDGDSYHRVKKSVRFVRFKTGRCWELKEEALGRRLFSVEGQIGIVVCGVPHWFVEFYDYQNRWVQKEILYFDIKDKVFKQMARPNQASADEKKIIGLGALDGQRQLGIVLQDMEPPSTCKFWVMKEYGNTESWTYMYTIPVINIKKPLRFVDVLGVMPTGELLIIVNLEPYYYGYNFEEKPELWAYNPATDRLRQMRLAALSHRYSCFKMVAYEPSVHSPPQPNIQEKVRKGKKARKQEFKFPYKQLPLPRKKK